MLQRETGHRVVNLVDGSRTPFLKAVGVPGPFTASDLAVKCGQVLLLRQPFQAKDLDQVILGCVSPGADEANIARVVSLRLGCGYHVPAWTVQRNCASGMQAVVTAAESIASGESELVLAGGSESMSHAAIQYNEAMAIWLGQLSRARNLKDRILQILKFRPAMLKPVITLLKGLTDPVVNLSMGQTAEIIARRFEIDRETMDAFALSSHQRLADAYDKGLLPEVETIYSGNGSYFSRDDGFRPDTNLEKLGKLKPVFDREYGSVTAGNSAQVTDGAAMLLLASDEAVKKYNLPIMARIIDNAWAALDPAQMGLGPAHAMASLMKQQQLSINDIDFWEINEAFAAQVLACMAAWADENYCRTELGLDSAMGQIEHNKLNIHGGGISLGHPVGASGARIILHMAHVLKQNNALRGIASLCVGGGQGGAVLLETGFTE